MERLATGTAFSLKQYPDDNDLTIASCVAGLGQTVEIGTAYIVSEIDVEARKAMFVAETVCRCTLLAGCMTVAPASARQRLRQGRSQGEREEYCIRPKLFWSRAKDRERSSDPGCCGS